MARLVINNGSMKFALGYRVTRVYIVGIGYTHHMRKANYGNLLGPSSPMSEWVALARLTPDGCCNDG
jgi:hypothetical protein